MDCWKPGSINTASAACNLLHWLGAGSWSRQWSLPAFSIAQNNYQNITRYGTLRDTETLRASGTLRDRGNDTGAAGPQPSITRAGFAGFGLDKGGWRGHPHPNPRRREGSPFPRQGGRDSWGRDFYRRVSRWGRGRRGRFRRRWSGTWAAGDASPATRSRTGARRPTGRSPPAASTGARAGCR